MTLTLEEKMRKVKGMARTDCLIGTFGSDFEAWAHGSLSSHCSGDTVEAAVDALLEKLQPDMTVQEVWDRIKAKGKHPQIHEEDSQFAVSCLSHSCLFFGDTLRVAYQRMADHFGWED